MKKGNKVIKNVIIVLAIIILSIVAFVGIYVKENGVYVNKIPNFTFGMEIDGTRELRYLLDTTSEEKEVYVDENGNIMGIVPTSEEETTDEVSLDTTVENKEEKENLNILYKTEKRVIKANPDEKTLEHFENTKKVIQDRLSKKKEIEYNIRLDTLSNNELVLEVPNNEKFVTYARNAVESIGKFEIIDNETGIILMDNSHVEGAVAAIGGAMDAQGNSIPGKSQVYLTITLTKEGKAKFNELSKKYPVTKDEAGNETSKLISMTIDGMKILETAFEQEYDNKLIQLPMGNPSDSAEDINQIYNEVYYLAMSVDSGRMPLVYKLATDNFIQSHITKDIIYLSIAIFAAFVLIVTIIFVVKFKAKGLMAGILNVGYIALVVIAARYAYTNI